MTTLPEVVIEKSSGKFTLTLIGDVPDKVEPALFRATVLFAGPVLLLKRTDPVIFEKLGRIALCCPFTEPLLLQEGAQSITATAYEGFIIQTGLSSASSSLFYEDKVRVTYKADRKAVRGYMHLVFVKEGVWALVTRKGALQVTLELTTLKTSDLFRQVENLDNRRFRCVGGGAREVTLHRVDTVARPLFVQMDFGAYHSKEYVVASSVEAGVHSASIGTTSTAVLEQEGKLHATLAIPSVSVTRNIADASEGDRELLGKLRPGELLFYWEVASDR